ncbi:MBL fold metallo-hydrolase [bacterium]|nr:MBL fold metallo-hydrolase [bacterium]
MYNLVCSIAIITLLAPAALVSQNGFQTDTEKTSEGPLTITCIGHGTLMFSFKGLTIHVDPVMREADYSTMPNADIILVTHEHGDHLDLTAVSEISKKGTVFIATRSCADRGADCRVMENGDEVTVNGIVIRAVPAYNIKNKRDNGQPFHPKGTGNGYILTFGDTNVYIAGDTENTPEMKALSDIDIAFLPMNLPYTMDPAMVADAARAFRPSILYPYHYGNTDPKELAALLEDEKDIEVRIRTLQ